MHNCSKPYYYWTIFRLRIAVIFLLLTANPILVNAQVKDSAAILYELQRLNQIRDSLTRNQLGKDSTVEKRELLVPIEPDTKDEPVSEKEKNYDRFVQLQETERRDLRKNLFWVVAGFTAIIIGMRVALRKQEKRKKRYQPPK